MRRAAKVDRNHNVIVDALRRIGCTVQSLAAVGRGCPDILVGYRRVNALLEIKAGNETLNDDQVEWHGTWRGQVHTVRTIDEALALLNHLTRTT